MTIRWLLIQSNEDGNPLSFLDQEAYAEAIADPSAWGVTKWLDAVPANPDHNYWPDGHALLLRIDVVQPPMPPDEPRVPCPEGFHWIGQSFAHCDACPFPAWEHEGIADMDRSSPFSMDTPLKLRPWGPGQREAIKAKWEGVR